VTWDDVRELALALPAAEESTVYRKPAFKVAGKTFAWESPHERGKLVLHCELDERPLMIAARPDVYFVTPHYEPYGMVLVHLERADRAELAERIEESWLIRAPKALADAFIAATDGTRR
jgi:hypothetical protein